MSFRDKIFTEFGLDMNQYFSLPMLTKDIFLKFTGAKLDLISDSDMCAMVRNNIRGGLSFVNTRYFDSLEEEKKTKEPRTIIYVDANNREEKPKCNKLSV